MIELNFYYIIALDGFDLTINPSALSLVTYKRSKVKACVLYIVHCMYNV